jgi:taurine dioxygenase
MSETVERLRVSPITPAIGAVIEGVDARRPLDAGTVRTLRQALLDHGVIFFRNQPVSEAQLEAFVANFGQPITEPSTATYGGDVRAPPVVTVESHLQSKAVAERWHADATWLAEPPMATALKMVEIPPVGGDTCWTNVAAAYDDLIPPLRAAIDQLTAVHWMIPSLEAMDLPAHDERIQYVHPVVTVHPETGRRVIFVSEGWTRKIVELPPTQSVHLLNLLYDHIKSPMFSMRWRWAANDVVIWDNRTVQHFAVPDYERGRVYSRVVLQGHRPYGPPRAA